MDNQNKPSNGRRNMIKAAATLGRVTACSIPFILPSRKMTKKLTSSKEQEIVIRTSGGKSHIAYTKILFEPFTEKTGIKVTGIPSNVEPIAEIKTMVDTGTYHWNMACLGSRAIPILSELGYLEPHQLEDDSVAKTIMPQALSKCSVGMNVYSTVLAYRTDVFKEHSIPRTWEDFWNVRKFPGLRSLRQIPFDTIEEALMADGVVPSEVYSCADGINRAFRSLDKIKSHISIWWQNAPQAEHLLKAGEVHLTPAFSTSVISAMEAGAPVAFSWDQHIYAYDNWTILKGTPNADACRQFIRFATDPERQARLIPYGIAPTQPAALEPSILKKNNIDPKYIKLLATHPENLKKGLFNDGSYWKDKHSKVIEQFNEWRLGQTKA